MLLFIWQKEGEYLTINERIKFLRKEVLHKTQDEFASHLKISRSNLGSIEIGRVNVTDRVVSEICQEFDINEEWLRTGSGEMKAELSKEDYIVDFVSRILKTQDDSFKKRYISMLSRLDERGWTALEQVATTMGSLKKD